MALTNQQRTGKALDLLKIGLSPFVDREIQNAVKNGVKIHGLQSFLDDPNYRDKPISDFDVAALLKLMWETWNEVFRKPLGQAERSLIVELRTVRNRWAHQEPFSSDDTYRALDSIGRLLTAVSAQEAEAIEKLKMELLRVRFDEQMRNEKRKSSGTTIESNASDSLKPWREVVTPHQDVASGRYQQAEFAADLWQVHLGEGSTEYRDPQEFFRRTFLTESLKKLLVSAVLRLNGKGGDPVMQLQTNFGGGKTHSMLALYHLFSGVHPAELSGVDELMNEAEVSDLKQVKRVVIVGNKISPGNPTIKEDGTEVRTIWGEMAWQLGGREAYDRIRADDEKGTSPGDVLRELFNTYGPCLILIDEWVAYARQLHEANNLPGGNFETHFSFAQVLTESAKLANSCLLVISLPASDTIGSPHTRTVDVEVGGERGRAALERLQNAVGRVEASWRPASAEEGFEIVRRRLFEPIREKDQFVFRDSVARSYADLYKSQAQEFPNECRDADYEKRIKAAYPIHPEVFDRLYSDWSTLVKFQRTRGVLRLMAAVIHSLWEKGDRNPLIQPANIPIDDPRVQFELTRYLSDNWVPVIEKDVDGPNSLPVRLDAEVSNLGKYSACRRVSRSIYLGSAPTSKAANLGLEDRRVKLGCVMPGESTAIFGDALRRLSGAATYLYQDGNRYWFSTQPTVTKLADDRADDLRRKPDAAMKELEDRIRSNVRITGDFSRVHPWPSTGHDIPDELDARLVVLDANHSHTKDPDSLAVQASKVILENRGNSPRLYRNTLVFLAADKTRLQDLDEALRRYLAWQSILDEREVLDLSPFQVKQAEEQKKNADSSVNARIPETYQWLLVPVQKTPQDNIEWEQIRLTGSEGLAVRAGKKLRNDELLIPVIAPTRLKHELDKIPLWRGDHVPLKQLTEDFARYLYLPRFSSPRTLLDAIEQGLELMTWMRESFGYADSYDEKEQRYIGLRAGRTITLNEDGLAGLIIKPDIAYHQYQIDRADAESVPAAGATNTSGYTHTPQSGATDGIPDTPAVPGHKNANRPRRYYGVVTLDTERVGRDAGRIAEEVIAHLSGQVGANVRITLEIEAELPEGASEQIVRIVTENARTLKFSNQAFENE